MLLPCSCRAFPPGASTDYLVIGSDSGKIIILEWHVDTNTWRKVHDETFGKTGCRRICPGQYLAVDPKGRAVVIGNAPALRPV
jgi:splicing factor 3B subunit 3